jgi:hypothetical protein
MKNVSINLGYLKHAKPFQQNWKWAIYGWHFVWNDQFCLVGFNPIQNQQDLPNFVYETFASEMISCI